MFKLTDNNTLSINVLYYKKIIKIFNYQRTILFKVSIKDILYNRLNILLLPI